MLIGLAAVLALARGEIVHLAAARRKRPRVLAAHAEQQEFRHVAEVEADAAPVRPAILADLVPDDVRLVAEAPGFHHAKRLGQKRVRRPQIQMAGRRRDLLHRQRHDLLERQRLIAVEPLVPRRNLPRPVLKLPRRIGQDRAKAPPLHRLQQILSSVLHRPRLSCVPR